MLQNLLPNDVFKHQNGFYYRVICVVTDAEKDIDVILHENVTTGRKYVRSVENFFGKHANGFPRFEKVQ